MKTILTLFLIFLINFKSYTQNFKDMTIFKDDNTQINVSGNFIYENNLIQGIHFDNSEFNFNSSYLTNLENITKVIFNKKIFLVKNYNSKKYLFLQVSNGALSLYKDKKNYYLESQKINLKEIPKRERLKRSFFKSGIVSVFINKCKTAVNELQNRATNLNLSNLKKIIKVYNNCNVSNEIQISDRIIEESLKAKEKVQFGLSFGLMNLKNSYDKIIAVDNDNLNLTSVGAKVFFNSNMLKYNDLNFNLSLDYFFEGQQRFNNTETALSSQIQFIKTTLGASYKFTNLNTNIKPYIGTSAGFIFHNSALRLSSRTAGSFIVNYNHNNALIYSVNAGIVFTIFNKDIDFLIEYQPNLNASLLKKSDINQRDESYRFRSLNFNMTYIF
jgi:hypothetical protein